MARRDFDKYFYQIYSQYKEMQEDVKDFEQYMLTHNVDESLYENMKKTIEPIKNSYENLLYIKYLLDMPSKKSKKNKYERLTKKVDKDIPNKVKSSNKEQLEKLENLTNDD